MMMFVVIGAIAVVALGACKIDALTSVCCAINKGNSKCAGGGAAAATPMATGTSTSGTIPAFSPNVSVTTQLISSPSVVMEYVANQATQDIEAGTFAEMSDGQKLNLKSVLLGNYKDWLYKIAEYNNFQVQPLQGRALAKYSSLILDVTQRMHIRLNPATAAIYQANLFAGTPLVTSAGTGTASQVVLTASNYAHSYQASMGGKGRPGRYNMMSGLGGHK